MPLDVTEVDAFTLDRLDRFGAHATWNQHRSDTCKRYSSAQHGSPPGCDSRSPEALLPGPARMAWVCNRVLPHLGEVFPFDLICRVTDRALYATQLESVHLV